MRIQKSSLLEVYPWMKSEHFLECVEHLPRREKKIFKLRFGMLGFFSKSYSERDVGRRFTLREVGKKLNISRERTRQLELRAIRRLEWSIKRNEAFCL